MASGLHPQPDVWASLCLGNFALSLLQGGALPRWEAFRLELLPLRVLRKGAFKELLVSSLSLG